MSECITTIIDYPVNINVTGSPIVNVTVNQAGTQGAIGPAGAGGTGNLSLSGYITTGDADLRYYSLLTNPSGYLTGFNSGLYTLNSQTGQFYPANNLQQYIKSGDVSTLYYTKDNESGFLNSLSGLSIFYVTGISGNLQSKINNLPTSNNLYQTGSNLYNIITGLSGQANTNYSSILNLVSTGLSLDNKINSLSGYVNNNFINSNGNVNIDGNLKLGITNPSHLIITDEISPGSIIGQIYATSNGGSNAMLFNVGTDNNFAVQPNTTLSDGVSFSIINDDNSQNLGLEFRASEYKFSFGDVNFDGKISAAGGIDPPYVLYDKHTRQETKERVLREVPSNKQDGAAMFYNSNNKRIELYVASEDKFYDINGIEIIV